MSVLTEGITLGVLIKGITLEQFYRDLNNVRDMDVDWDVVQLSADVVERKKGKWEGNTKDESWKCSECGFIFYSVGFYNIYNTKFRMRFCPNCGADMREGEDGEIS